MVTKATEVTGCSDCPFVQRDDWVGEPDACAISDANVVRKGPPPKPCPLRQGPVTTLLKSASCPECGANGYQDGEKLHAFRPGHGVCSKLGPQ